MSNSRPSSLTPNQQAFIERFPHLAEEVSSGGPFAQIAEQRGSEPNAPIALPVCNHRGILIDQTACRCLVYACKVHGTCSNSSRAGLTVCPCDAYQHGLP